METLYFVEYNTKPINLLFILDHLAFYGNEPPLYFFVLRSRKTVAIEGNTWYHVTVDGKKALVCRREMPLWRRKGAVSGCRNGMTFMMRIAS